MDCHLTSGSLLIHNNDDKLYLLRLEYPLIHIRRKKKGAKSDRLQRHLRSKIKAFFVFALLHGVQLETGKELQTVVKPALSQTATPSAASLIERAPSTGVSQSSILSAKDKADRPTGAGAKKGLVWNPALTLPSPTNPNNPPIIHQNSTTTSSSSSTTSVSATLASAALTSNIRGAVAPPPALVKPSGKTSFICSKSKSTFKRRWHKIKSVKVYYRYYFCFCFVDFSPNPLIFP